MKNQESKKGMFRRTFGLYKNISVPWHLYILQIILGILSAKVVLLYIPYEAEVKLGNIEIPGLVAKYLGFLLLATVMQVVTQIPKFYASAGVTRNLQTKLINRSLRLPMRAFETNASRIVSWITQDAGSADGLLTSIVGFFVGIAATYMSVTQIAEIDTSMLILVPVIVIYIIFSTWLEGRLLFLRQRSGSRATAELTAFFSEHLGFFTQIKLLHAYDEELERGKSSIHRFYRVQIYQELLTLLNNIVSGSIQGVINILVFVMGVPMVRSGAITMPQLVAFQTYILMAYGALSSLPSLYTSFMYYNGQLFYVGNLMAEREEVYTRKRSMDIPDQDIKFDNVSFSYDNAPVIQDATFTIPKGKVTAIAGPNGSGKTTLFKLIERFYDPDKGTISFGDYPVEDIHLKEWRQSIAYVLQDSQLFNGTVRENITYGMEREASDEEVAGAAKLACAEEFIGQLPGGYDFVIGDNGSRLSAGQRQRIAIARALMLDPSYLLLDEATCNIDVCAERSVIDALAHLMKGRTTVMISHDMDMLDRADNVVVLNDGKVEAAGTKDMVERTSPTLQRLIAANKEQEA